MYMVIISSWASLLFAFKPEEPTGGSDGENSESQLVQDVFERTVKSKKKSEGADREECGNFKWTLTLVG